MTIDIRANVNCSLGEVISGSVSDDYIQGSGLIKVTGNVLINGLVTPSPGTIVTFSYTKNGIVRTIPRKLRVKSSFADPLRRTTQVELGCKLDYLSDLKPSPSVSNDPEIETSKRLACLTGYTTFSQNSKFGFAFFASQIAGNCLAKLGITALNPIPLTSVFRRETFDLTSGYVNVLSDLLLSESYCGYLNEDEQLVIFNLDQGGGTGPVLTNEDIIDLGNVGVGGVPGDAVVVRYESKKLKKNLEDEDEEQGAIRDWTSDEVTGSEQSIYVRYELNGVPGTRTYTYIPYTKTITQYGKDNSWDKDTCQVSARGGANLGDTAIKKITTSKITRAEAANDYCAQLLSNGIECGGGESEEVIVTEEYKHDEEGQVILQTTTTEEPYFAWAGRLGLDYVYDNDYVILPSIPRVITTKVVVKTTTLFAALPSNINLKPGESFKRVANGQKVVTTRYANWGLIQQGQQGSAGIRVVSPFTNASQAIAYLEGIRQTLVIEDTTVNVSQNRIISGVERRPPPEELAGGEEETRLESTSELLYITGSSTSQRIVEFSIPYSPDDWRSSSGSVNRGTYNSVVNRFGRVQNRFLMGSRNGISLQLMAERLPVAPYSPIYVELNGLTALYRTNGTNWAFDKDGIICSVDALFWAAVGGTGEFWFPVAPGIVTLPAAPTVIDTSPTGMIGTIETVGAAPQNSLNTAFPNATIGDGVQDETSGNFWVYDGTTWNDAGRNPGPTTTAVSTILPYNEIAVYESNIKTTTDIVKIDYGLQRMTVVPPASPRIKTIVSKVTLANTGLYILEGRPANFRRSLRLTAATGIFALSPQDTFLRPARIAADNAAFVVSGQQSLLTRAGGDPYWNDVKLMLHLNGANGGTVFTDSSPIGRVMTFIGEVNTSTAQSKFGGSSGFWDGSGDTIQTVDSNDWNLGAQDFTIEAWIRPVITSSRPILSHRLSNTTGYAFDVYASTSSLSFSYSLNGTTTNLVQIPWSIAINTWTHFAICRDGTDLRFFQDGTLIPDSQGFLTTPIAGTIFNSTAVLKIGQYGGATTSWSGYIDELRFTLAARYTATFAVQTAQFPDYALTV